MSSEKQALLDSNTVMSEKLKSYESIMNSELEKLLHNMFKELNICTSDLNDLVKNCLDLHNGLPVDVTSLLGHKLQIGGNDSSNLLWLPPPELSDCLTFHPLFQVSTL